MRFYIYCINRSMAPSTSTEKAMTILQINSSLYSGNGQSSRLADELVAALRAENPRAELVVRDLAKEPVPHLDEKRFQAFVTQKDLRSEAQEAIVAYSDTLIDELRRADVLVLGLPMYNFGVSSQLKSWIDHIARAGETFRYTAQGPVGLLTGKKAYVLAARGGLYAGSPADTQTAYVRSILGFLGITDVEFVYAEGLAISPESREKALAAARARIDNFFSERIAA
jgi:FMN-dependent NADH-azoreductase